jgi:Mn2+/Fe2+ NRAMP family transporter
MDHVVRHPRGHWRGWAARGPVGLADVENSRWRETQGAAEPAGFRTYHRRFPDDPSGIATYSQAGAQFGYATCWVMLFCFPLMAAIQEISARMGRVTGRGIAGNIRADLGAMGAAPKLLIGGPTGLYVASFAIGCVSLEVFSRHGRYVSPLKWTSFVLLAYVAVALVVDVRWRLVLYSSFVPSFSLGRDYVVTVVAVPLMVIIMLMAVRRDVMGPFVLPRALRAMGWLCTVTMAVAVGIMFATW